MEAPFSFAASEGAGARVSTPPSPSCIGETLESKTVEPTRRPTEPPEVPRGRRGSISPGSLPDEEQSLHRGKPVRQRSGSGPRASPTLSWSRTVATVPAQLIGGSTGTDASFLTTRESPSSVVSVIEYRAARRADVEDDLRSLLSTQTGLDQKAVIIIERSAGQEDSSPKTPSTGSSSSSGASQVSNASSYAPLLRNNRADRRLLNKKSQPLAWLVKKPPRSRNKSAPVLRITSYNAPKVISDTAAAPKSLVPANTQQSTFSMTEFMKAADTAAPPLKLPPTRTGNSVQPASKPSALRTTNGSGSSEPLISPLASPSASARPALTKPPSIQAAPRILPPLPPVRYVRIEVPEAPHSNVKADDRETSKSQLVPTAIPLKPDKMRGKRLYHDVTPPEADSRISGLRHGEHYFRTFDPEPVFMKDFTTPTLLPTPVNPPSARIVPLPVLVQPAVPVKQSSNEMPKTGQQKRGSIFSAFRKAALMDSTPGVPRTEITGTVPFTKSMPSTSVNDTRTSTAELEILSSPPVAPPPCYFAQSRGSDKSSSSTTPQGAISPMTTSVTAIHRRPLQGRQSSSDSLSPFTRPRFHPRLQHQRTLEDIEDAELPVVVAKEPIVSPGATAGPQPRLKAHEVAEYYRRTLSSSGAHNWIPWESSEIDDTVVDEQADATAENRKSMIKQLITDVRRFSSVPTKLAPRIYPVGIDTGRAMLRPMASVGTLLRKASRPQVNKLKRKASQATVSAVSVMDHAHVLKTKMSLEVTDFHQTPYSKRYGNTKRADAAHIRTLVEDALDDDEGDEDVQIGFERDVPDHLPSSPLCPLSPMHKSGGKAICPLHGRKRPILTMAKTISKAPTTKVGPSIVYEGKSDVWVDAPKRDSVGWADSKRARISQTSDGAWYS